MARGFCLESRAPREYKMTDSTTTVRRPAGFDQLIEAYDGFIFDVWGTLYDGRAAYDGAVAVLRRLADRGKPVAILSNSPQRPEVVAGRLARIGIDDALYQTISPRAARHMTTCAAGWIASMPTLVACLRNRSRPFSKFPGRHRVHGGGPDRGRRPVVEHRPERALETVADYRVLLDHALSRNLPMICANPTCMFMSATRYRSARAVWRPSIGPAAAPFDYHGKPHAGVFRTATARLQLPATRCLMVGDNYRTDVRGAFDGLGMGALWLADGIDRDDLLTDRDVDLTKADDLLRSEGLSGVWVMARLA